MSHAQAAYNVCLAHVRLLLAAGADVNARAQPLGDTPLHICCEFQLGGNVPGRDSPLLALVSQLLSAGADVNAHPRDRQLRPLDRAVVESNAALFMLLLSAGADVRPNPYDRCSFDEEGGEDDLIETHYLAVCIANDSYEFLAAAMDAGVVPWEHTVVRCQHDVEMLLLAGMQPSGGTECLKLMIQAGADVNAVRHLRFVIRRFPGRPMPSAPNLRR